MGHAKPKCILGHIRTANARISLPCPQTDSLTQQMFQWSNESFVFVSFSITFKKNWAESQHFLQDRCVPVCRRIISLAIHRMPSEDPIRLRVWVGWSHSLLFTHIQFCAKCGVLAQLSSFLIQVDQKFETASGLYSKFWQAGHYHLTRPAIHIVT